VTFLFALRAVVNRWLVRLGFIKPKLYERDIKLPDVINRIVCTPTSHGAFIVAVETKQAMIQLMSYMEKNGIGACAVSTDSLGRFHRLSMKGALACMEVAPYKYQVYVMNKSMAAVGWRVPREYKDAWGKVNLMPTFEPREPWSSQFFGRARRS
jgi:hypothetical protein